MAENENAQLVEALELVAGRLDEVASYLSSLTAKLEDIDFKLLGLLEKSE
jgi:hypothetical protein